MPESSDIGSSPAHDFDDESEIIPQGDPIEIDEEEQGEDLIGDNLEA